MADNQFSSTVEALFKGMDSFVTTKTVVGEAVKIDDAIILPLVDVSCGMAAGAVTKIIDMVPDFVNRFAGGVSHTPSQEAVKAAEDMADSFQEKEKEETPKAE